MTRGQPLPNRQLLEHTKCVYIRLNCACCVVIFLQVYTLQITDTTGSHQFPAMQRLSISKSHAFVLVYSLTDRQSLEELKPIYSQICNIKGDAKDDFPIVLVGNKSDEATREVTAHEVNLLTKSWKCHSLEASAKNDHNVKELFQELLQSDKRRALHLDGDARNHRSQTKTSEKLKEKCHLM